MLERALRKIKKHGWNAVHLLCHLRDLEWPNSEAISDAVIVIRRCLLPSPEADDHPPGPPERAVLAAVVLIPKLLGMGLLEAGDVESSLRGLWAWMLGGADAPIVAPAAWILARQALAVWTGMSVTLGEFREIQSSPGVQLVKPPELLLLLIAIPLAEAAAADLHQLRVDVCIALTRGNRRVRDIAIAVLQAKMSELAPTGEEVTVIGLGLLEALQHVALPQLPATVELLCAIPEEFRPQGWANLLADAIVRHVEAVAGDGLGFDDDTTAEFRAVAGWLMHFVDDHPELPSSIALYTAICNCASPEQGGAQTPIRYAAGRLLLTLRRDVPESRIADDDAYRVLCEVVAFMSECAIEEGLPALDWEWTLRPRAPGQV
jgi:hypothetical protein